MKQGTTRTACIVFLLSLAGVVSAQVPTRHEQFVYSIVAYNGTDFSGTFTTESARSIYLLAGEDNFITSSKAFVYFWPITRQWRSDNRTLNQPVPGRLEVRDHRGDVRTIDTQRYTYYNEQDEYGQNWIVKTGEEAVAAEREFRTLAAEYRDQVEAYRMVSRDYESHAAEMRGVIQARRAAGGDVSALIDELSSLAVPTAPQPPGRYVVPPSAVQEAFVVNLPAGEYTIELIQEGADGVERTVQDSTKRVVVFEPGRTAHIGYDVVPGDRWTRPAESSTPASVIYVTGDSDLFLRPFFQNEYNDLWYQKLYRNDARGNPGVMRWAHLDQVRQARIDVSRSDGTSVALSEEPYFVEQSTGGLPGYTIVPFEGAGRHAERDPSLRAFRVQIRPGDRRLRLEIHDESGNVLTGGEREIRIVEPRSHRNAILYAMSAAPLLVMVGVKTVRRRRERQAYAD